MIQQPLTPSRVRGLVRSRGPTGDRLGAEPGTTQDAGRRERLGGREEVVRRRARMVAAALRLGRSVLDGEALLNLMLSAIVIKLKRFLAAPMVEGRRKPA